MPEPIPTSPPAQTLKKWLVPAAILLAAAFLIVLVTVNWNAWTADRPAQVTDDAYLRADLTPLSTKAAGLVAKVAVSDYQLVKSGDLLIQLRDDDFQAQVREAEASLAAAQDGLVITTGKSNCRMPRSPRLPTESTPPRPIPPRRRPASKRRTLPSQAQRAASPQLKPTWNGRGRNVGARRR